MATLNEYLDRLVCTDILPMHRNDTDRRLYLTSWEALNHELRTIEARDGNMLNAVDRLREHQLYHGFIQDDLHAVECFSFPHPDNPERFLSVQYNPARMHRLKIRVDALPPPRNDVLNDNCFLCSSNIEWQHKGLEMGYAIDVNGRHCNIWMNAYPLLPVHIVVATEEHVPQAWCLDNPAFGCFKIDDIIANLVSVAEQLPGYMGFYNGGGAGTSVPAHFHYQFFKRRNGGELFPLELAPTRQVADLVSVIEDYPVDAVRWVGNDNDEVVARATAWINDWLRSNIYKRPTLSANIYATADVSGKHLQVYFVPRDTELSHSPHMAGMIGSLEILGELVLTTENEKHDLDRGQVDYHSIARILSDIRVPL